MLARLIWLEETAAALMLAAMVLCVFAAALCRSLGWPIIWSVDIAQLLFIWVCMLGANRALRRGEHVGVDALVRRLPLRRRMQLDLALYALTLAFLLALAGAGLRLTVLNPERTLGTIAMPYAMVTLAVPVGALLMSATLAGQLWHLQAVLRGRREADLSLPFTQKYSAQSLGGEP